MSRETNATGYSRQYAYDGVGNVTQLIDRKGAFDSSSTTHWTD